MVEIERGKVNNENVILIEMMKIKTNQHEAAIIETEPGKTTLDND